MPIERQITYRKYNKLGIIVDRLSKSYGNQRAVDGISFSAKAGKILGFLGPNGAGKSTTMRMLTGYLTPTSGTANVAGFDIVNDALDAKKRIGFLPENTPLYQDMYVQEFLKFAADIYHVPNAAARVKEVIEQVGLSAERKKKIFELSKGYKQRVGLAQAIIHHPEVLILDEPTSGLDPNQLAEIRTLIKSLGETRTVILSTHIMQEVELLCDDVIIIHKGKIVANSTLANLKAQHNGKDLEEIFKQLTQ